MKYSLKHTFFLVALVSIISGCSTTKNTWASRTYQAINTRFNVYFNGYNSYNEGLVNIQKANREDYSTVIPMYPISHHSNASAATTNMDLTIEKCRKAIKLHSIKVKPKKNYKKANAPEYMLYYNQQEFNPALIDAWLLLAKAEFHKGDFLGSVGTFSYINRHYATDKNTETTCQLWIARAYGEMGWIYEAEQVLSKINQDNLKHVNTGLFASVNADILLKKHRYKEAIPFLELAISKETDKSILQRFNYILAQLFQKTNDNKAAYTTFSKVIKSNPPYEMDFNARISRAQLDQGNIISIRKELSGMLKNRNNKDYLDQLYFALGNTYLHHADTVKAIDNFKLSAEKSTRNGIDKAMTLITLGDIYYKKRKYVSAQPCYDEAGKILTNENEDYARVTRRGEMLSELVTQNDIVVLQDSLQRLATLSETKQLDVVNKIIEKLIADEKAATEKALKEKQAQNRNAEDNLDNMLPIGMNPGATGDWYFYNIDVMRNGESEFLKIWGNRKLEDNWRRTNKTTSLFADESLGQTEVKDSTDTLSKSKVVMDNKKPEFYLRQIPSTPAQIANSKAEIATALFSMGQIYKDNIIDIPLSISTFKEFISRFPTDKRVPDAYFNIYLMQTKEGNMNEASFYRTKLITEFPKSKYQRILSQSNYLEHLENMHREEDSIYNLTYKAYNESDFSTVFKQAAYIKQHYPLSTLMPKFLFLNALSIGKKETPGLFKNALDSLVTNYPESDVSAMAKDILALIKQGQEAKTGTSSGSLLSHREESTKSEINEISPQQFSFDKQSKHRLLLVNTLNKDKMNKLLYSIASFNFSRFLIKNFDLIISKLDSSHNVLSVTNFESYDEVVWYVNSLNSDVTITNLLTDFHIQKVIISEDNYALLKTSFSLNDYLTFLSNQTENTKNTQITENRPTIKPESGFIPKKDGSTSLPKKPIKTEIRTPDKSVELVENKAKNKQTDKSIAEAIDKNPVKNTDIPPKQETTVKQTSTSVAVEPPKQEEVPLFKGLFGYKANEPHFIAIYIVSGTIDFAKIKTAFDDYNAKNYGIMNLKTSLETVNTQQVVIIGSLNDAQIAKSYLLRMVKEKSLFEGFKKANYRNLLGSQKNINIAIQNNALNQYFEFMQEYYLK